MPETAAAQFRRHHTCMGMGERRRRSSRPSCGEAAPGRRALRADARWYHGMQDRRHTHTRTHARTHTHTRTQTRTDTRTHTRTHTHTHTHARTHTHTRTRTHTHTHTCEALEEAHKAAPVRSFWCEQKPPLEVFGAPPKPLTGARVGCTAPGTTYKAVPFTVWSGPAGLGCTAFGTTYKAMPFRVWSGPAGLG